MGGNNNHGGCRDCECWGGWFSNISRRLHCIFRWNFVWRLALAIVFGLFIYAGIHAWNNYIFIPLISNLFGYTSLANRCYVLSTGQAPDYCRGENCERATLWSKSLTCDQMEQMGFNVLQWGKWVSYLFAIFWMFVVYQILEHFWRGPEPCHHRGRWGNNDNSCDNLNDVVRRNVGSRNNLRRSASQGHSQQQQQQSQRQANNSKRNLRSGSGGPDDFSDFPTQPFGANSSQQTRQRSKGNVRPDVPAPPVYDVSQGGVVLQPNFDNQVGGLDFGDEKGLGLSTPNSASLTE